MEKYLLIGYVSGIGGWQLYTEARADYLAHNNMKVYILSEFTQDNYIKLKGFRERDIIFSNEVFRPMYTYTKKQIERISNEILKNISFSEGDRIYIEATNIVTSVWGEYLAKKCKGVCVAYILQSYIQKLSDIETNFLKFKYDQNLLFGMSKLTIPDIFKGSFDVGTDVRELLASWRPPIGEEKIIIEDLEKLKSTSNTRVIGFFGNLDKPNFTKVCVFLKEYCKKHYEYHFVFLSIGSSSNGIPEKKQQELENVDNVFSINIPSLYPVPKSYFDYMDVCLASWGSATVAAKAGTISIRFIDDVDIIPHGIIGITLVKKPYYEYPKCEENLEELLDDILFNKKYFGMHPVVEESKDNDASQKRIHETLMTSMKSKYGGYYDVSEIKAGDFKNRLLRFSNRIIGIKGTQRIIREVKKIRVNKNRKDG